MRTTFVFPATALHIPSQSSEKAMILSRCANEEDKRNTILDLMLQTVLRQPATIQDTSLTFAELLGKEIAEALDKLIYIWQDVHAKHLIEWLESSEPREKGREVTLNSGERNRATWQRVAFLEQGYDLSDEEQVWICQQLFALTQRWLKDVLQIPVKATDSTTSFVLGLELLSLINHK